METLGLITLSILSTLAAFFAGYSIAVRAQSKFVENDISTHQLAFKKKKGDKRKPVIRDDIHAWHIENKREPPRDI